MPSDISVSGNPFLPRWRISLYITQTFLLGGDCESNGDVQSPTICN